MKTMIVLFLVLMISVSSSAETIRCKAAEKGPIRELQITRHLHGYEPQWYEAWITPRGFLKKKQKLDLTPLYFAGHNMKFVEFEGSPARTKFYMELPKVQDWHRGPQKARVTLNKGSAQEVSQNLSCQANEPLRFMNYCENSLHGNPDEALLKAARSDNANLVEMLMSCEPNVNFQDSRGCTPLMLAIDRNCGSGHFDDYSSLSVNLRILEALISGGAFVDLADPATEATPLSKSAWGGDVFAIKSLLDMEADVDAQDNEGYTPLMRAVARGHRKAVELILKYRPQLDITNHQQQTAEMIAHAKGYHDIALWLQEPVKTLSFQGLNAGGCELSDNQLVAGQLTAIELQATEHKMYLLTIPELEVELMANPGEKLTTRVKPVKPGRYHYQCGVHGGAESSRGFLSVEAAGVKLAPIIVDNVE